MLNDPRESFSNPSYLFEKSVLSNSKKLFKPSKKWPIHPIFNHAGKRGSIYNSLPNENDDDDDFTGDRSSIWWWEPPKRSIPIEFCNETSTHGLKFLAMPKRHLTER
jgi:hypothetical protein